MPANSRWDLIRGLKGQEGQGPPRAVEPVMMVVMMMMRSKICIEGMISE